MDSESDKKSTGRPTDYTPELADTICARLSEGESLRSVCKDENMPSRQTVFNWMRTHKGFLDQYARAKQESADAMAEDILTIAEVTVEMVQENPEVAGPIVQAQRLHVDAKKWLMSKMKPKKYGDQIDITSKGESIAVLPAEIYGKRNTTPGTESDRG